MEVLEAGGGDHAVGGGGFSGGSCEGGHIDHAPCNGSEGCGGSYFRAGCNVDCNNACVDDGIFAKVGGQGNVYINSNHSWGRFSSGSGGKGGNGGSVEVSGGASISAYNGDACTSGNHSNLIKAIDVTLIDLSGTTKKISTTVQSDNQYLENVTIDKKGTITPCYVVAQSGKCRETYYVNHEGNTYDSTVLIGKFDDNAICYLSTEARTVPCYMQGIGSGAGYLEVSNGSYKIDGVEQMK